jgi:hypothetical protein
MRNDLSDTDTIEILRAIKSVLDRLMNDPGTGVHVRLNELYDHARRDLPHPILNRSTTVPPPTVRSSKYTCPSASTSTTVLHRVP